MRKEILITVTAAYRFTAFFVHTAISRFDFGSKGILVLVVSLSLAALACNLPLGIGSDSASDNEPLSFQDEFYQELGIDISDIYLQGDQIVVEYDSPWTQDEASMLTDWVGLMIQALEADSSSSEVRIDINHLDDPFYSITSTRANVEDLLNEEIGMAEFYEMLQFSDRRAPEQALAQKFASTGFEPVAIAVENGIVSIDFFQQPTFSTTDVLLEWIRLLDQAASFAPDSEKIVLNIIYPNAPAAQIEAKTVDILEYRKGNLSPAEFLARLEHAL